MDLPYARGALFLLLVIASVFDWRHRRIPNWLSGAGVLAALAWQGLGAAGQGPFHAVQPGAQGLVQGLAGGGLMLLLGFISWKLKFLGGGDGKLLALVGAFVGVAGGLKVFVATLVAGGLLAMSFMVFRRLRVFLPGLEGSRPGHDRLPYAVAIALGTVAYAMVTMHGT